MHRRNKGIQKLTSCALRAVSSRRIDVAPYIAVDRDFASRTSARGWVVEPNTRNRCYPLSLAAPRWVGILVSYHPRPRCRTL